jgi:DNA-binding MarR family transcriptional regulator
MAQRFGVEEATLAIGLSYATRKREHRSRSVNRIAEQNYKRDAAVTYFDPAERPTIVGGQSFWWYDGSMIAAAPPPTHAGGSVGMLLTVLGRASTRLFTEALRPIGLKPRHVAALNELRAAPLTQQALGEQTHTDPTKLVGLLNDLERWSLLERRRDPADRRRHIVAISDCGRARLAEVDRLVAVADQHLLDGLEPEQQSLLLGLLESVAARGGVPTGCPAAAAASDDEAG